MDACMASQVSACLAALLLGGVGGGCDRGRWRSLWHAAVCCTARLHVFSRVKGLSPLARTQGGGGADPRAQLWRKVSGLAALAEQLAAAREAADPYAPAARGKSPGAAGPYAPTAWEPPREVVSARQAADTYAPGVRDSSHDAAGPYSSTAWRTPREVAVVGRPAAQGPPPQGADPRASPTQGILLRAPASSPGRGQNMRRAADVHAPATTIGLPLQASVHVRRGHLAEQPEACAGGAGAAYAGRCAPATVAGWGGRIA